jgi:large subunit ribosomal protein L10
MDKNKKKLIVSEFTEILKNAEAVFVTDFKGLSMASLNQLRVKVRAAGAGFKVGKNTLTKMAAKDGPAKDISPFLSGNNALAFTNQDPVSLAKALTEFAKEQDSFKIKSGVLSGKILGPEEVKILSTLPSKKVLMGSFLGLLAAVPTSFVRVLSGPPRKILYFLKALEEKIPGSAKEAEASEPEAPDSPASESPPESPPPLGAEEPVPA